MNNSLYPRPTFIIGCAILLSASQSPVENLLPSLTEAPYLSPFALIRGNTSL